MPPIRSSGDWPTVDWVFVTEDGRPGMLAFLSLRLGPPCPCGSGRVGLNLWMSG